MILQLYQKFTKKDNPNLRRLIGRYSSLNFTARAAHNDGRSCGKIKEDEACPLGRVTNIVDNEGGSVLNSRGATAESQTAISTSPLQLDESEDNGPRTKHHYP